MIDTNDFKKLQEESMKKLFPDYELILTDISSNRGAVSYDFKYRTYVGNVLVWPSGNLDITYMNEQDLSGASKTFELLTAEKAVQIFCKVVRSLG